VCTHRSGFRMVIQINIEQDDMNSRNPDAVYHAYQETMEEIIPAASFRNDVSAENKNDQPENPLEFKRDKENCSKSHGEPKKRKLKN